MMNIPPSEADRFSLYEYEELLYHWNEAHSLDDAGPAPPQPDRARKLLDGINANPLLIH